MEAESAEAFQKVTFGSLVDDPAVHRVDANVRQRIIRGDFSPVAGETPRKLPNE